MSSVHSLPFGSKAKNVLRPCSVHQVLDQHASKWLSPVEFSDSPSLPPYVATGEEAGARSDLEDVSVYWNAQKAAENQRRVDLLAKSLEDSDIHDLQVLRKSLQRQVDTAVSPIKSRRRSLAARSPTTRSGLRRSPTATAAATTAARDRDDAPLDEDERWRADILRQRLDAIEEAVERKGGWRAAVLLAGESGGRGEGEVNVDVDVEPWPAADAVLMLQTVRDALNVQLMEVTRWLANGEA